MALFVCAFSFLFPPPCRFVLVFVRFSGYCFIRFWFWFSLSVLVLVSGFGLSSIGAGFGFLFWYPGFWVPIEVFCVVFLFWAIYFGCTRLGFGCPSKVFCVVIFVLGNIFWLHTQTEWNGMVWDGTGPYEGGGHIPIMWVLFGVWYVFTMFARPAFCFPPPVHLFFSFLGFLVMALYVCGVALACRFWF